MAGLAFKLRSAAVPLKLTFRLAPQKKKIIVTAWYQIERPKKSPSA